MPYTEPVKLGFLVLSKTEKHNPTVIITLDQKGQDCIKKAITFASQHPQKDGNGDTRPPALMLWGDRLALQNLLEGKTSKGVELAWIEPDPEYLASQKAK